MKLLLVIGLLMVGTGVLPSEALSIKNRYKHINGFADEEAADSGINNVRITKRQGEIPKDQEGKSTISPEVMQNKHLSPPEAESGVDKPINPNSLEAGEESVDGEEYVTSLLPEQEYVTSLLPEQELVTAPPSFKSAKVESNGKVTSKHVVPNPNANLGSESQKEVNIRNEIDEVVKNPVTVNSSIDELNTTEKPGSHNILTAQERAIFALVNTNVNRSWEEIPFRERYAWASHDALCHRFDLFVPHEGAQHGRIQLCLYRKEVPSQHGQIVSSMIEEVPPNQNVFGFVLGYPKSNVEGNLRNGNFLGRIVLGEDEVPSTYVVEEVTSLTKLMKHSGKLLQNLLIVMNSAETRLSKTSNTEIHANAIVTTGVSLESFLPSPVTNSSRKVKPNSFLVVSAGHNSFFLPGDPLLSIDEKGRTVFRIGQQIVTIGNDVTVNLAIKSKDEEYKFRPNGQSILMEGLNVTNLEQEEGPVAVFAVSEGRDYSCILPSPAFSSVRSGGFVCKICVTLDKSFRNYFTVPKNLSGKTVDELLNSIFDHVTWIFRSIDWNQDGKPDDIGINFDPQFLNQDYSEFKDFLSKDELEEFYMLVTSADFSDCCLGIVYTMKTFPGGLFAKSGFEKEGAQTGICGFKTEDYDDDIWNNVILISGNNKQNTSSPLTPAQLLYLTAHEIGKAFGGALDATGDPNCDSFEDAKGVRRHFLLWPDFMRSISLKEKAFSPCSLESIYKVLDTCHSSCFEMTKEPFCGNGIVEMGEECDCGSEIECARNRCCYSRYGEFPCQKTGLKCKGYYSGSMGLAPVAAFQVLSILLTLTIKL